MQAWFDVGRPDMALTAKPDSTAVWRGCAAELSGLTQSPEGFERRVFHRTSLTRSLNLPLFMWLMASPRHNWFDIEYGEPPTQEELA